MDLVDVARIALRRWYVVVLVLLVGGAASLLVASSVAPTYTVETQSILVNGAAADQTQTTDSTAVINPYLQFSGSLFTTASAVTRTVDGAEYRQRIADEGYNGDYKFSATQEAPVVITDVTADSPDGAVALGKRVQDALSDTLSGFQTEKGVPADQQISMQVLTTSIPSKEVGSRNRVLFGMLGVTLAAAIGGAVLVESIAQSRARSREQEGDEEDRDEDRARRDQRRERGRRKVAKADDVDVEASERLRSLFSRDNGSSTASEDEGPAEESRSTGT